MARAPYASAVIAALAHLLVIVALPRVRPRAPDVEASPAIDPIEIDVAAAPAPDTHAENDPPAAAAASDTRLAVRAPSMPSPGGAASPSAPVASGEPSAAPDVEPAPSGSATFTVPRPLTPAELGIASGGPNPFATSPGFAPPASSSSTSSSEASRPPAERALRDALRASDRIVGLGPEGPAITALREATSSSLAPLNGRALFAIRAGENGEVIGIDLLGATGGTGWDDAKRLALEAMRGKKLTLPRGAKGANVRIEIVSELSYPSGQGKALEFGMRGGALVLPDESNIGQRPTRKIHARATGTEIF